MVDGRLSHEGSLEHGNSLRSNNVQVQRAGGEGFSHNEINPDDNWNRMIQLWVLPEQPSQPADYKVYQPVSGELTRIYGIDLSPLLIISGTMIAYWNDCLLELFIYYEKATTAPA